MTVLDVLRRAKARRPGAGAMRAWLTTPVGARAMTPLDLLRQREVDYVRVLAMSSLPKRERPQPEWLANAPINAWSAREQRRRDWVMRESDAINDDEIDEG